MKRTTALVLAGGHDQIALIDQLRKRGMRIFLADYLEAPPAAPYVERHFRVSTLDTEAILSLAHELRPDHIVTACTDQALLTAAAVSEKLGLFFYISHETALTMTNKAFMKKRFADKGIPSSAFRVVSTVEPPTDLMRLSFPLVVKPADCNSSKGVIKVLVPGELPRALTAALKLSRTGTAIVEEYFQGRELSVDAYIAQGHASVLSITESIKDTTGGNFTIIQSKYPAAGRLLTDAMEKLAGDVMSAFGLANCPLLMQVLCNGDAVSVVEVTPRLGGGTKYRLIETIAGVPVMQANVQSLLGETPDITANQGVNCARLNYCYCRNGTFTGRHNFKKMKESGLIDDFFLYKTPGMTVSGASASNDRIAGYLLSATDEESLQQKQHIALEQLEALSDDGTNMLLRMTYE